MPITTKEAAMNEKKMNLNEEELAKVTGGAQRLRASTPGKEGYLVRGGIALDPDPVQPPVQEGLQTVAPGGGAADLGQD
jgi:bacteriocin-like protein